MYVTCGINSTRERLTFGEIHFSMDVFHTPDYDKVGLIVYADGLIQRVLLTRSVGEVGPSSERRDGSLILSQQVLEPVDVDTALHNAFLIKGDLTQKATTRPDQEISSLIGPIHWIEETYIHVVILCPHDIDPLISEITICSDPSC